MAAVTGMPCASIKHSGTPFTPQEAGWLALQGAGGNVEVAVNRLLAQPTPADGAARSDAAEVVVDDD